MVTLNDIRGVYSVLFTKHMDTFIAVNVSLSRVEFIVKVVTGRNVLKLHSIAKVNLQQQF